MYTLVLDKTKKYFLSKILSIKKRYNLSVRCISTFYDDAPNLIGAYFFKMIARVTIMNKIRASKKAKTIKYSKM